MLLAPVFMSRGNTENTSVLVTGIHQNTAILLTGRYPKYFVIAIFLKNLACERLAPSIHQAPRVRLGTQYSVGHLISTSHSNEPVSLANHSIW